jgi:hypothetical protein
LAPRIDWHTLKSLQSATVVIQMSIPKRATSVSQTSLCAQWAASRPEKPKSPPIGCRSPWPYSAAVIG